MATNNPSGGSFVGHVPGSEVEAADRPSQSGAGTVQHAAAEASGWSGGPRRSGGVAAPLSAAGQRLGAWADSVEQQAPEGPVGELAGNAALALRRGGAYLENASVEGMQEDITRLVRTYPLQSLAVGIGLGFLLARLVRR